MAFSCRIGRLSLTDYRSYAAATLEPGDGPVVLVGPNGAGKTNILEAVSMLAPGRGLRGSAIAELARADGPGGWAVAAEAEGEGGGATLGTGAEPQAPERRLLRVNGAPAAIGQLGERLAIAWLTPAMDRLLAEGASARRRFLDRLVLALHPAHGRHAARYEAAMRERTRLLACAASGPAADPAWLAALEARMAEHGAALAEARRQTVEALAPHLATVGAPFPSARLAYVDEAPADLAREFAARRVADGAAGRATFGPHRADLAVTDQATGTPAARCSTGEQKALLIGILLAHAALVAERRGLKPILLLDEVAAHLDEGRRRALLERLPAFGQAWLTGTEPGLFDGLPGARTFAVRRGVIAEA